MLVLVIYCQVYEAINEKMNSYHEYLTVTVKCTAGTYRDDKVSSCTKCPENKVAEQDGATSCTSCSAGKMANAERTKCGNYLVGYIFCQMIILLCLRRISSIKFD